VDEGNITNVFYLDELNRIHDLIIRNYGGISQNKFIDYNFSTLTDSISSNANYAFARIVQCLNGDIQHFGNIKNELKPYVGTKFIIDIIPTNKTSRNECYIFFNELMVNETDPQYEQKYNHQHYSWSFGVIKLDLSFSNDSEFDKIEPGYSNKKDISILDSTGIFILKRNYFSSSVILQDDLFTIIGYEIEDCKIENKKSFINYLWEKDIILNSPFLTTSLVPKTESTEITTVNNDGTGDAYLIFNDISKVNLSDFRSSRNIKNLNDGKQYLQLSSPSEKEIKIGSSSVSYDLVDVADDSSYTISFNVDETSIQSNIATSIVGTTTFNDDYAPHKHLLMDSDYRKYTEFEKVYADVPMVSYSTQKIRQDGIQVENINPPSYIVPLTGNEQTVNIAYLQEILPYSSIVNHSIDFAKIIKLSGDGNTALVVVPDYVYVNIDGTPKYNVKTSKALIYRRCGEKWAFVKEILPTNHNNFNVGVFFEISDAEKIDVNIDGTKIVISSRAHYKEVGTQTTFGSQFNYDGYVVRTYTTIDGWNTYSQQVIQADVIIPREQQQILQSKDFYGNTSYNYDFGYSVSISDDGSILLIGSPSEHFSYKKYDATGALLDQKELDNNGVVYLVTTRSISSANIVDISASIGLDSNSPLWNPLLDLNQDNKIDATDLSIITQPLPYRNYIFGDTISGSNWKFVSRLIPQDSDKLFVGGVFYKDCISDGIQGKRFGEKVRLDSSGLYFVVSSKFDSQSYLNGGAVYIYNTPNYDNNCIIKTPLKQMKVVPSNSYKNMNFSKDSLDFSKDASTIIVGSTKESSNIGLSYIFKSFDWDNISQNQYVETSISDPESTIGGNFGMDVKLNYDASIILIKNKFNVKQFNGVDYSYVRRYFEFNKIPKEYSESGESLDLSYDGHTVSFGCIRNEIVEENRAFIFDDFPITKGSIVSTNCPSSGSSPIDLFSIPILYLTEVNYIPYNYTVKVLVDELLPLSIIGKEVQQKEYKDINYGIIKLHCNGNESVYALDLSYNFKQKEWYINFFNNKAQQITLIIAASEIELSPNYVNTITLNTTRKQVNGYYCGKRYYVNFEINVNGKNLYKDSSYTFDTTNTYVVTFNYDSSFISSLTYMEVRDYLESSQIYNKTLSVINSNVYWATLDEEQENLQLTKGFENFIYKRLVSFNNLPWGNKNTFVVPIVLQGNGYNVNKKYNHQITRNIFEFGKIDISYPSFGFSYEGGSKPLVWTVDNYDPDKDMLVIWVKLEDWNGQKIVMYYGDVKYIKNNDSMNPFEDYYGVWRMNKISTINRLRYDSTVVYNGGEAMIVSINSGNNYISQVNKQFMLGNREIYKSNKFDVSFDDANISRNREEKVKDFIKTNVKLFAPAFMEIHDIVPMENLLVESNSELGERNGK
jgi:hypothetical protein